MRRLVGVLVAVALLGGAALGMRAVERTRDRYVRTLAARLTAQVREATSEALHARLLAMQGKAAAAAQLPQLRASAGTVDVATLRDLFHTEPWWQPTREEFPVYGIALSGDRLELVEGEKGEELGVAALVSEARKERQAAALVATKAWPFLAAAAAVDAPNQPLPAVLVLARPFDGNQLHELAQRVHSALLLSDGRSQLLVTGPDAEREQLRAAIGREREGSYAGDDPSWSAAALPLIPGFTLWVHASAGAQAAEAASTAKMAITGIWALAGLLALLAIGLGLRAPPPPPPLAVTTGTTNVSLPAPPASPAPVATEDRTEVRQAPAQTSSNVFGRYVLLDRLGEGGMAEVYTAVAFGAENFRRTFVVKRLRPEMTRVSEVVAQFIDEANLASSLVHSNIVPVFDFGKVGEEYFIAQEYILGRDLGRVTRRALELDGRPLAPSLVLHVAHETLRALEYAHGRSGDAGKPLGIVHRDVSPNNILVSARGEVKLFDFGIAKAEGRITQTQVGTVKGNVRFMSPEQAQGNEVDSRADLYSLGLVIYYALAGDTLYQGDNSYNLLVKAAQGPSAGELQKIAALDEPGASLVARALQVDPARRFQTAGEFAAAIAPHLSRGAPLLGQEMERLFGADIRAEEARFAAAVSGGSAPPPGGPGATGSSAPARRT